jgi:dienelactone hydrolase
MSRRRIATPLGLGLTAVFMTGGLFVAGSAGADGPADNIPVNVRPVPPPGIPVPAADRAELQRGLAELTEKIDRLRGDSKAAPWLPDVQIFQNAIRYALEHQEFLAVQDIGRGKALLAAGLQRADQLAAGQTPWLRTPGPQALGYVSDVDGSVQPYGLYIPDSFTPVGPHRWRLDTWFHGRGETLTEINFVSGVMRGGGPFVRPDTFVLQPYGRYCCGNKLVGEVDLFEALKDVERRFKIDRNRLVMRGFSMGGAACWTFASHYSSLWAAAAPGAGFSETPEFLKVFQRETLTPTWYEQKLWMMYDSPYYSANFFNLPVVAYSGEIDSQKQAADVMEKALAGEGIQMTHIIGPKTGHSYHRDSVPVINGLIDSIAERGRVETPQRVKLATPTLKYHRQAWVIVDALGRHWDNARVDAELLDTNRVRVSTKNVEALTLEFAAGQCPLDVSKAPTVILDGKSVTANKLMSDRSWTAHFHRAEGKWVSGPVEGTGLRKQHDLQGPIDDAFMQSFLIVRPTGTPAAPGIAGWVKAEMDHAVKEWRRQFRGEPRIADDTQVTDAQIAAHNLALWGDPGSNRILARIADKLPIRWTAEGLVAGDKTYSAGTHAPILIYPNPLNPKRYVVLNSGFTYREYDYLNNARQVPKLPDWAIVDTTTPPNSRYPGKIVTAAFFGENWEWLAPPRK